MQLLNWALQNAPIQQESFSVVRSGADVVGIAQTGTGKRLLICYILQDLKYSKIDTPRVLVLVPTRELVIQLVDRINELSSYMNVRVWVFTVEQISILKKRLFSRC